MTVRDNLFNKVSIFPHFFFVFSVLNLTEAMGNKMHFEEKSVDITVPLLAMSMVNTDVDKFSGLTFGVSVNSADLAPQVRILPQTRGCKFAFKAHRLFSST